MAITSLTARRVGTVTTVTAVSSLSAPVYFHWYIDGAYVGMSRTGQRNFSIATDEQSRIDVADTNDVDFDPLSAPPAMYPARFTIHWIRSLSEDVAEYAVEHAVDAGAFEEIARVTANEDQWSYQILSDRLDDLATHSFRVVPYDRAGNDGTPIDQVGTLLVRTPDAPEWSYTYNTGTDRVTFIAA